MVETAEQAELRRHLRDLRQAAHGIGRDVEIKMTTGINALDAKISRLPEQTAKDLKYFVMDIDNDFRNLGRVLDNELSKVPGAMHDAGSAIAAAAARAVTSTGEALQSAGKKTVSGTKNLLASAAGVRRTPMKQWRPPGAESKDESEEKS